MPVNMDSRVIVRIVVIRAVIVRAIIRGGRKDHCGRWRHFRENGRRGPGIGRAAAPHLLGGQHNPVADATLLE